MKISYAICTHNESESLFNLTEKINQNKDTQDEIVFLDDHNSAINLVMCRTIRAETTISLASPIEATSK